MPPSRNRDSTDQSIALRSATTLKLWIAMLQTIISCTALTGAMQ